MLGAVKGYCSGCFNECVHTLHEQNHLRRNIYECSRCKAKTVICRVCSNMALTGPRWDSEFCAEHDGSIASFRRLGLQLDDITDYPGLFVRDSTNFAKVSKVTLGVVGGAAVMIPAALVAAPAIGGAIGASCLGLSGAAATNAGLALLGGGSLAAGGMGMAGGVAVISASGAALGGVLGGVVSNSYFSEIEGFKIEKLVDGGSPAVIAIDGFLSQGHDAPQDWISSLKRTHAGRAVYYVRWESKRLAQIAQMLGGQVSHAAVTSLLKGAAKRASKSAAGALGPAGAAVTLSSVASNPWSVAMVKAEMTGALLADIICRTKSQFTICGHSLGARVAHFTMLALARNPERRWLSEVHLMGGAVGNHQSRWQDACGSVAHGVFNYHSDRDDVLKYLYAAGTVFRSSPVGRYPVNDVDALINVDVTETVGGHSEYKSNFPFIRRRPIRSATSAKAGHAEAAPS